MAYAPFHNMDDWNLLTTRLNTLEQQSRDHEQLRRGSQLQQQLLQDQISQLKREQQLQKELQDKENDQVKQRLSILERDKNIAKAIRSYSKRKKYMDCLLV